MTPLQCNQCGRFIGSDGYPDIAMVDGVYEEGYSMCGPCGRAEQMTITNTNTDTTDAHNAGIAAEKALEEQ